MGKFSITNDTDLIVADDMTVAIHSLDERSRERARDAWNKKVEVAFLAIDRDIGLASLPGGSGLYNIHGTELNFGAAVYALKGAAQRDALERHLFAAAKKMGGDLE